MCDLDLETCEVFVDNERTARKEHVCDSCGACVRPRDRYFVFFCVFDGKSSSEKMCSPCREAMAIFGDDPHHMETMPSSFPYILESCVDGASKDDPWLPMLAALRARGGAT